MIAVLVIIALGIALWLRTLKGNLHDITSVAGPRSTAVYQMVIYAKGVSIGVLKYLETGDPAYRQQVIADQAEFARFRAEYDRLAYTPQQRELGERISTLFGKYKALGETLMNTKDRQQALFAKLAQSLDAMARIIDDKIQAKLKPAGPDGPLKVRGAVDLEVDIAEVGTWLGNYLRTSNPVYKARVFENAKAVQKELEGFKTLRLTPMERQWVGELESRYAQALSQLQEVITLHEAQQSEERRFWDLLAQLDRLMDIHLRLVTERGLTVAQDAVQEAVNRILAGMLILLGVGVPIALGTSIAVGRRILNTEERITELLANERNLSDHLRQLAQASLTINSANTPESVLGVVREEACKIVSARRCLVHMEASEHPPLPGGLTANFWGHGGRTLGAIQLIDKLEGEFTDDDEALLKQLANMAGVAIENARLYEELRQRDQRKDEFLATLAHELRNPLAPIGNALEILPLAQDDGATSAQARETIERQFQHLVRLVDDLLDISRITRGRIELRKKRVALSEVMQSALESSRPLIESCGHELTVTLPEDPVWLEADATRLAQAIANLLNNAAKYTPKRGHIALTAERAGESVAIKVRDTGIGIRAELLPQVFDLFAQVDTALERAQGGLGIGLFLVKKLVELHGGSVEAHSAGRGQGAEFIVRLPVASEDRATQGASAEAGARPVAPLPARRVLVVDDNRDAAESLGTLLRMLGHEVYLAFDGLTALEAARRYRPDLVLLDIGLPGMHGYDVAQRIRKQPELREVVLVAVTGWGQEEDRRRAREAGFDHHLTKPLNRTALERLLATVK